ncbi:retrovirus-related Pol polyprotein from transposon 412 [Trichonephila inaurata madagascariensis]|uniref:Retrovirus-related Pol polyprotein from transposon 412 n=1 Tax=Trichonephila inaurata madagascariensis TaxID=2747483 RepID=A0A8X6MKM3_9ARAC|nr:retrovirus-related Pol polyprotein from transposon 412 [Trichonephila inaurata madagascariensis]
MSSKYPEAISTPDLCSTTVVDALLQIFSRLGFPRELQTDQGTSFMSVLTTEFLDKFGIRVVRSSVPHPQSNPLERMQRTLKMNTPNTLFRSWSGLGENFTQCTICFENSYP